MTERRKGKGKEMEFLHRYDSLLLNFVRWSQHGFPLEESFNQIYIVKFAILYFITGINVPLVKGTQYVLGPSSGQLELTTIGFKFGHLLKCREKS